MTTVEVISMRLRTMVLSLLAVTALIAASASAGALELITPDQSGHELPEPDTLDLLTGVPAWAAESSATIRPGVQTSSPSGGCTANFVFYDSSDVYLGSAAHCTILKGHSDPNGCVSDALPVGTKITVQGAAHQGTVVYNSWRTMHEVGETNADICGYNDFALIKLDPADRGRVNPTVPHWGGPNGLGTTTRAGEDVYANGNSRLRLGLSALQPKVGAALGQFGNGWHHRVYLATPGIPGDSGGAVLNKDGQAVGVFHTIILAPYTGANEATDLQRSLHYMKAKTDAFDGVELAWGTRGFSRL